LGQKWPANQQRVALCRSKGLPAPFFCTVLKIQCAEIPPD
jgi:hypothetical protein